MVLFTQLVTETAEMAGISAEELTISRGRKKRWRSIAAVWVANPNIFEDIFYKALAHIAFGRYPSNSTPMKPLLELVEKAILTEGDALVAWRGIQEFSNAFSKIVKRFKNRRCGTSYSIQRFGLCRFYMRTFYRDELCKPINLATDSYKKLKRAQAVASVKNEYDCFKKSFEMFIPDTANWTDSQWISEKHLLNAFLMSHGVDYFDDIDEFDCLMTMLKNKLNNLPYYRDLFRLKKMSDSMAAIIWDTDFEKNICKQFVFISRAKPHGEIGKHFRYPDSTDPFVINQSWAFKAICSWCERRTIRLSDAVRGKLLLFAMGEHPFTVKEKQKSTHISCI